MLEAAEYIPLDRLGTTDDCGFAPFGDDTSTARETAFAKIRARVEGTALAAQELGVEVDEVLHLARASLPAARPSPWTATTEHGCSKARAFELLSASFGSGEQPTRFRQRARA